MAQRRDSLKAHAAGALNGPLIVLLEEDGADEANDGVVVREDADHFCPALDPAVEALDRVRAVQLGAMLLGEGHVGQHVGLGMVHDGGELRHLGPDLIGHAAPLGAGDRREAAAG
jgi:hypothetical protein